MTAELMDPTLVLCQLCLKEDTNKNVWGCFLSEDEEEDQVDTVFVRDVCAVTNCAKLQVRNHFCVDHAFESESSRDGESALTSSVLRHCAKCLRNVKELYDRQVQVWMMIQPAALEQLDMEELVGRFHIEKRVVPSTQDPSMSELSPARKRQRRKRRSLGKGKSYWEKEKQLAMEWSCGNIQHDKLFLWKENERRHHRKHVDKDENETDCLINDSPYILQPSTSPWLPPLAPLPKPAKRSRRHSQEDYDNDDSELRYCAFPDCRRLAKTGDCCRFHSELPMNHWKPRPLEIRVTHVMI